MTQVSKYNPWTSPSVTADLVQRPDETQHLDLAAEFTRLPDLVEAGDTEELARVAHEAELVRKHHVMLQQKQAADEAATLLIYAQAGIGVIDIRLRPARAPRSRGPLSIAGRTISPAVIYAWRTLGYAELQGMLPGLITRVACNDAVTPSALREVASAEGAGFWNAEPIRAALLGARDSGMNLDEVAKRSGLTLNALREFSGRGRRVVSYEMGLALARGLGLRPDVLSPMPPKRSMSATERKRRRRAAQLRHTQMHRWRVRDEAVRARSGKVASLYAGTRRLGQQVDGAREKADLSPEARSLIGDAWSDLEAAALKLYQAALLG